jgi:hypothetical protein
MAGRTTIEFRNWYRALRVEVERRAALRVEVEGRAGVFDPGVARREVIHFHRRQRSGSRFGVEASSDVLPYTKWSPPYTKWPLGAHPPGGPSPRGNFVWSQRFECRRSGPVLWEYRPFTLWNGMSERVFERELLRR